MKSWESPIPHKKNIVQMYDISVVEIRGFVGSDLDASVIASASARRGSHGETVVRFLKNRTIHLFPAKIKQAEQGSTCVLCGGDKGIRTPDLRIANATLYQLSHIPTNFQAIQPLIFACLVIISHYAILATKF